ncbi:hypothetical protein B0T17DRAFT_613206 [Bombardia bombarda]|uniref:BTB domain-containing protein n=1 Tax=Bombardia bombarda TaxID=252184 RepID=A0AA39XLZ3_9PEZI|nr:hypothetical protein B0T17DRAFT_613206 [Bombardia bombarda]
MATRTRIQVIDPKGDVLLRFAAPVTDAVIQQLEELEARGKQPVNEPWSSPESMCTPDAEGPAADMDMQLDKLEFPQPVNLQVSSVVLGLASPVFYAMFNLPMTEGEAFRAPGSPRPFPISLPEDNGEAFAILAHVIHHRTDAIPFLPSTAMLLAIAALADKYVCAPALMPYGVLWLQRATEPEMRDDPEYGGLVGRCNLLLFAYVLDLPVEFARLSWDVLLSHRQLLKDEMHGLELPISPDHELLRHDLHGEIARRKARLRCDVHNALMEPISRVLAQLHAVYSGPSPEPEMRPTCPNAALAIGNYMALLDSYNLSPWRPQYETDSFSAIISRALEVAAQAQENPMLFFEMCTRNRCACDRMVYGDGVHLARRLAFRLGGAWKWKLWVCLDCLKNGGVDKGNCRVKHW